MTTSSGRARHSNNQSALVALVATALCAIPIAGIGIYLLTNLTPEPPVRKKVANQTRSKRAARTSPRPEQRRSGLAQDKTPGPSTDNRVDSGQEPDSGHGIDEEKTPDDLLSQLVDTKSPVSSKTAAPPKSGADVGPAILFVIRDKTTSRVFDLPDAVELKFPTFETAKTKLGRIRNTKLNDISIAIDGSAAEVAPPFEFRIARSDRPDTWEIGLFAKTDGETSDLAKFAPKRKIALVEIQNESVHLLIPPGHKSADAAQLRNCVLTISNDAHRHHVQLRSPKKISTIVLKLDGTHVVSFSEVALPKIKQVFMELISIEHPSTKFIVEPPDRKMRMHKGPSFNEQLIVAKFEDWPEAGIQFDVVAPDSKPRVVITPYYFVEQKKKLLSLEELSQTMVRMQKSIVGQQQSLAKQTAQLAQYRSRLSAAQSSSPSNTAEAAVLTKLIADLTRHVNRIPKKIKVIEQQIPKTKATLENLEKLQKLAQEVHGSISIQLQVTCKSDRHMIDLLQVGSLVVEEVDK